MTRAAHCEEETTLFAPVVLSAATVLIGVSWSAGTGSAVDRGWATGLLVLGWLEFVNYFAFS
jgi:hypothetical protein